MNTTIPTDLAELKESLETWRANRQYKREPIPNHYRQAALEMTERYSPALVRRVLKLDPWRLKIPARKNSKSSQPAFFKLPPPGSSPVESASHQPVPGGRLQIERPDGSRLSLTLSILDSTVITALCDRFLRGSTQ